MIQFETIGQKKRTYASQLISAKAFRPKYFTLQKFRDGSNIDIAEKFGISERTVQRMRKLVLFMEKRKMKFNVDGVLDAMELSRIEGVKIW